MLSETTLEKPRYAIKQPKELSPRIQWLRDYYFQGVQRKWNNEFTSWTTGTPWDFQYNELTFYIVPETYFYLQTFRSSFKQTARPVALDPEFWHWSLPERRAWFVKEVMLRYLPRELLPGDLIAGGRFNIQTSCCLNESESREFERMLLGKDGRAPSMLWFHNHGFGNTGATSGHLIPDYKTVLENGWKGIHADLQDRYESLSQAEQKGSKGAQLRAMMTAATMARDLAGEYRRVCLETAANEPDPSPPVRAGADGCQPGACTLGAAAHLLGGGASPVADAYAGDGRRKLPRPGPVLRAHRPVPVPLLAALAGRRHGARVWQGNPEVLLGALQHGLRRLSSHRRQPGDHGWLRTTAHPLRASVRAGEDLTNDLTFAILEVIDEMSPILEPKPNVRLHRGTPDALLDKVVEMIASSQGAPFLLNFDERSIAGLMLEAEKAGVKDLINPDNVYDYAPVGCLENTMCGNDRSGTVDNNLNLLKAVELALTGGYDLIPYTDPLTGKTEKPQRWGPDTGAPAQIQTWEQFWQAYETQTRYIIQKSVEVYEKSEAIRAKFFPTPYLSCLVRGCAEKGLDVNQGGAELSFVTIEGVTYATTVDSLLAVKYLVFDQQACTLPELVEALKNNWAGYQVLQAKALHKAPKYGQDDDQADAHGTPGDGSVG